MSIDLAMDDRRDGVEEGQRVLAGDAAMASANAGEVSGPVATMTLSQSSGGRPATSSRSIVTSGCASSASVRRGEGVAVDGESAAGRHLVGVGAAP